MYYMRARATAATGTDAIRTRSVYTPRARALVRPLLLVASGPPPPPPLAAGALSFFLSFSLSTSARARAPHTVSRTRSRVTAVARVTTYPVTATL